MLKFISLWLPVIVWEILIFSLSSIPQLELTSEPIQNFISRKIAHILEYLMLAALVSRALGVKRFKEALVVSILLAISDEIHQSFVPTRTAKVTDILFDLVGISLGVIFYQKYYGIRHTK